MANYLEEAEEKELFSPQGTINLDKVFSTIGSAGRNPEKLARILAVYEQTMASLGWLKRHAENGDRPAVELIRILTQYQASIDAKYHNDFKEILIAQEIERRRAERKGTNVSILSQ